MDIDNTVPLLVRNISKSPVPKDTGVVDEDIDSAIGVNRGLHHSLAIFHRSLVSYRLASQGFDLVDNRVGIDQVIHDNLCTEFGKSQSICSTETRIDISADARGEW